MQIDRGIFRHHPARARSTEAQTAATVTLIDDRGKIPDCIL
jgi:hypothetical protein